MIGLIRGHIIEKKPPHLLLDVNGIGYEIAAPMTTFYQLPALQQEVTLFTHLVIREDAHTLYGFHAERDRRLFRALIKVNGVGPKLALTILSGMEPKQFIQCVVNQQADRLTGIPGIGRKTAERLIIETKDALSSWHKDEPQEVNFHDDNNQPVDDAISGLIALGYKPKDAKRAIQQVQQPELSSEELIRAALRQIVEV